MNVKTVLFIGPQGSGKGTQAKLLADWLEDTDREVLHFETGAAFRELAETTTVTGQHVRYSMQAGNIQPAFLAISLWAQGFVSELADDIHLVLDGSPRTQLEAAALDEALLLYERLPATVIHLTLSEGETYNRLAERARDDDHRRAIETRLAEYEEKTLPIIDFYEQSDDYDCVQIDGDQSIEAIQEEIRSYLTS